MHKDNFFTTGQYTFLPRFCFQGRSKDNVKKKKKKKHGNILWKSKIRLS